MPETVVAQAAQTAVPHLWHYAGAGLGMGLAVIGAGLGIGRLAAGMAEGIARQPSAAAGRQTCRCSCSKASRSSRSSSACSSC